MTSPIIKNVTEFMDALDYPLKPETQTMRGIITAINSAITEHIKWNAPSFNYHDQYLLTFNVHDPKQLRLVWHHPKIVEVPSPILEGNYPDRRLTYIKNQAEIVQKQSEIERIVRELIRRIG